MTQFAELLRGRAPGLETPLRDATGLEGGWDFTLTYSLIASLGIRPGAVDSAAGVPAPPGITAAADPVSGYTVIEAIERQLGLKLEKAKRKVTVTVIDSIEPTPTEN